MFIDFQIRHQRKDNEWQRPNNIALNSLPNYLVKLTQIKTGENRILQFIYLTFLYEIITITTDLKGYFGPWHGMVFCRVLTR
jgi:hypothetical protein